MPLLETHPRETHLCAKMCALTEGSMWSRARKPPPGRDQIGGSSGVTWGKLLLPSLPLEGHPTRTLSPGTLAWQEGSWRPSLERGHFTHHTRQGPVLPTRLPAPCSASEPSRSVQPRTGLGGCAHPSPPEVETPGPASPLLNTHPPLSITCPGSRGRLRLAYPAPPGTPSERAL